MTDAMNKLSAGGRGSRDFRFRERKDEVGRIAGAVQIFKDGLIRAASLETEKEATTPPRFGRRHGDGRAAGQDFRSGDGRRGR
jgi:methyl-accepting chemotaxis protein